MSAQAFADLNNRASAIGAKLIQKALDEKDLPLVRTLRQISADMYDSMIEMVKEKPDYPTWHAILMKANRESPFNEYDTTGEFTKLVAELAEVDGTEHYFKEVAPLLARGVTPFIMERAMVVGAFDQMIVMLIKNNKDNIRIVD